MQQGLEPRVDLDKGRLALLGNPIDHSESLESAHQPRPTVVVLASGPPLPALQEPAASSRMPPSVGSASFGRVLPFCHLFVHFSFLLSLDYTILYNDQYTR